jgi:hypothetical protein
MSASSVDITELIDRCPFGWVQISIFILCSLVALLDGFDLLAIGVAAPAMAGPLHIASNQFGFIFSAALFGGRVPRNALSNTSRTVSASDDSGRFWRILQVIWRVALVTGIEKWDRVCLRRGNVLA